jgi:hypothetical protein
MSKEKTETYPEQSSSQPLYCSFCGKSQNEVCKLIAGPAVFICDECIDLCNDIIAEEPAQEALTAPKDDLTPPSGQYWPTGSSYVRCALCRMPNLVEKSWLIPDRGVLCPVCIDAILAAIASELEDS